MARAFASFLLQLSDFCPEGTRVTGIKVKIFVSAVIMVSFVGLVLFLQYSFIL